MKKMTDNCQKEGLYSIILLSYYSEERIINVYEKIVQRMEKENIPFEFIIIDDGSKDNSYNVALELEGKDDRVCAYQLSKNYTSHYAKFAGFSVSKGDCVTSVPDDFQMPLDIIVEMYRLWQDGNKLVVPFRKSRNDGFVKAAFSRLYYFLMGKLSEANYPPGGADGFLADREIVEKLNKIEPRNTSSIVEVLRLGFNPYFLPFDRPKSTVVNSRWTMSKKIKLAIDTFFSFSSFPIKMITTVGLISFMFSITLIFISIYVKLKGYQSFGGISIPGWTSNVIIISFFSGLILFSLGVIAEYIWRIFDEVKGRPGFIIKKKEDNK